MPKGQDQDDRFFSMSSDGTKPSSPASNFTLVLMTYYEL